MRQYVLEGLVGDRWTELARGQSIGHKRIERFHPIEVTKGSRPGRQKRWPNP